MQSGTNGTSFNTKHFSSVRYLYTLLPNPWLRSKPNTLYYYMYSEKRSRVVGWWPNSFRYTGRNIEKSVKLSTGRAVKFQLIGITEKRSFVCLS